MAFIFCIIVSGPLALITSALWPTGDRRGRNRPAVAASGVALATALAGVVGLALSGPMTSATLGAHGIGLALRLDALSATVALLVAFVGWVVMRYARTYLDGDAGQARFMRWLALTLAAVLLLVLAGNLFQLALAWVATSLALNRLLLFYPDRVNAVLAARKKFVASRLADLCVAGALVLLWRVFGTLDVVALSQAARSGHVVPGAAGVLIAVAALLKSAQLPLHGWLTEVMETPTPVSALLHAGVINAGGFLVLRTADIVAASPGALATLAVVGAVTALIASLVMLTQTSVKLSLAWSTIAQMGFMLLQCALGAFAAALLHIVAHSLYKAHAFLASGSVIDIARASWSISPGGRPHPWRTAIAATAMVGVAAGVTAVMGAPLTLRPASFVLTAILLLALLHLLGGAIDERPTPYVVVRALAAAIAVALLSAGLQAGAAWLTRGVLPVAHCTATPVDIALALVVVVAFALLTVLQSLLPGWRGPRVTALWVHAANGFYLNTLANRAALQLWPAITTKDTA